MVRHRALRWLLPVAVVCVAVLAATGLFRTSASSEELPGTTPTALIAAMQRTGTPGFSGTVVSHLSLGLPELPAPAGIAGETSFDALLNGSHTMQVWYGGRDRQRIALLGATDETDLFRNGRQLWQYSSAEHLAQHAMLPARAARAEQLPESAPASLTPLGLARRTLDAIDPTTKVTVEGQETVADRSAYELVLTPREATTKIGSVHIYIDGATKVPLGVQVYPRGSSAAAVDVAFTSIHFGAQADRNFVFTPPPNATVRELGAVHRAETQAPDAESTQGPHATPARPSRVGTGWTTVLRIDAGKRGMDRLAKGALGRSLTPVAGTWGKGRLLDAALLSVLVTDDGRLFVGAVQPADLYAAAARK